MLERCRQIVIKDNLIWLRQKRASERHERGEPQNDAKNSQWELERVKLRKELADYLGQLGADTILNKDGQTALMQYASALNLAGAQMMLRLGSNPNAIDGFGRTTLHFLCQADVKAEILPWLI